VYESISSSIMKRSTRHNQPLSLEETEELQKVQTKVNRALANCSLSRKDREDLLSMVYSDGKVSAQECELLRTLQQKIWQGEVHLED
jgi:hypothetical protein